MKMILSGLALFLLMACASETDKPPKKVDNAATRYTRSLQSSQDKARAAQQKANATIEKINQRVQEATDY